MKRGDFLWLAVLVSLAACIWLRDAVALGSLDDSAAVLGAFPLLYWLGKPWRFRPSSFSLNRPILLGSATLFLLGALLDLSFALAAGWTAAFWSWLRARVEASELARVRRLLPLLLLAFPWVTLDLQSVGWWFRLSGAWSAQHFFDLLGFRVSREGVGLIVQGLPVSVDASCSGLKALQALLIAGVALAYAVFGRTRRFWPNLALLPPIAWIANTARIVAICAAAMTWGSNFAMGWFHAWGGLAVLVFMFSGCWLIFSVQLQPAAVTK